MNSAVFLFFAFATACSFFEVATKTERVPSAVAGPTWLDKADTGTKTPAADIILNYSKRRKQVFKKNYTSAELSEEQARVIARYIDFLKLPESEKAGVQSRLFESSLSFLDCVDLEDWSCLEATPKTLPLALHRVETSEGLGAPLKVNAPLDMDYYFTEQWYRTRKNLTEDSSVKIADHAHIAAELQKVINSNWSRVSMAIYGIDGLGEVDSKSKLANNSMQDVFSAIKSQPSARAVVDIEGYRNNQATYQYPPTVNLFEQFNQEKSNQRLRLEWPAANIMHNKFFVFEDHEKKSVWTGTANISKNCMGDEDFANMAVYVKNTEVAESYLQEFEEMFQYMPEAEQRAPMRVGRFHKNKRPNTRRYFTFSDGSEMTLHFSPTDDGEHRALLPLLLSARAGDVIRISMFGSGGHEYVRAMQYAAARGAIVKVFVDRDTSFQISTSWINRKAKIRLQEPNPYGPVTGSLEIRHTDWGAGNMNHHKSATLTRKTAAGSLAQVLVVGSQNWSTAGNDENDENMLVIRNLKNGLNAARSYNTHFDNMIWPTGKKVEFEAAK